jgi:hypothetical protein
VSILQSDSVGRRLVLATLAGVSVPSALVGMGSQEAPMQAAALLSTAGALTLSATDYGAVGDGVKNDSEAWTAAIRAAHDAGGGVVSAPRGRTYKVQNLPLLPNVYLDLAGIKLKLPPRPSQAMFVAPALKSFEGGGVLNGELDGSDKSQHCFDFSRVERLDQYLIDATYVHHFNRGYTGSKNDRWPLFRGIRWWNNRIGVFILTNHPIIHFCDFRHNDIGLTGHINDLYVIGTKFNFNRVGTEPAPGGVIINSRFTGCMWFRNDEKGLEITHRTYVGGGGMFVGRNTPKGDVGLLITGMGNIVEGMQFGYEASNHCFSGSGIRFAPSNSSCESNLINGNFFSVLGEGPGIDADGKAGQTVRANVFSNNAVRLGAGKKFMVIKSNFSNNKISLNSLYLTAAGLSSGEGVIELSNLGQGGTDITDNTFLASTKVACKALLLGNVSGSNISGNRFRNFSKPVTAQNWPGAGWSNNNGFRTANQGEASISASRLKVSIAHGLALAPKRHNIQVTPTNGLGKANKWWVSNVTKTHFTINVNAKPGSSSARFAWRVDASNF